jgi:hypothetical protein
MSPKICPHCLRPIPLKKRFGRRCPFCFKLFRRHSALRDRTVIGQFLEDRTKFFWFFVLTVLLIVGGAIGQISGTPDLINFVDARPVWFFISVFWLSMFAAEMSKIYFPLLLGAPTILRKERWIIRQYKILTGTGFFLGVGLVLLLLGADRAFELFPALALLLTLPIALMWSYLALVLTEQDYEDDRTWSYLAELGCADRLEHKQHGMITLIFVPLCGLLFFYFVTHPWLAWAIRNSTLLAMFRELWNRAKNR